MQDRSRSKRCSRKPRARALASAAIASAAALLTLSPGRAHAQQKTFYLDRLYMAGAPEDAIPLWRPTMGDVTRFYGQVGVGFALNPFRVGNFIQDDAQAARFKDLGGGNPVTTQLIWYGDVGVEILNRFALQVELPVIAPQFGNPTNNASAGVSEAVSIDHAALMDLRFDARVIAFRNEAKTFKLGFDGAVWVPTGNAFSFASDRSADGLLGLAAEYDFSKWFLVFNTGVQFRPTSTLHDFGVTHEWRWGLGGFVPLRDGTIRLGAEVFGSTGLGTAAGHSTFFRGANTPLEWMLEGRLALDKKKRGWAGLGAGTRLTAGYAPDFRAVGVIGYSFPIQDTEPKGPGKRYRYVGHGADTDHDGIPDDIDLCPNEPEDHKPPNPDDGCPALADRDGDGIPDVEDKCPDNPEDFDGIQDADGCPEDDADHDGIPDAQDACPKEPGERSPEPSKNGCPQFIRRIKGSTEIEILQQIQFDVGKATIKQNSFKILDEVVKLLKVNPDIKLVSIEGHTDNTGSDELNEKLSNDRAHSVMQYLVSHGIEAKRLTASGYGPRVPIADNNTAEGRQKNRRTEFKIKEMDSGATAPKTAPPPK